MPNSRETIVRDILLNVKTKVEGVEKTAKNIQNSFNNVSIDDKFAKKIDAPLDKVIDKINNLKTKLDSTMTANQMSKWNSEWKNAIVDLEKIITVINNSKSDLNNFIPSKEIEKQIASISSQITALNNQKNELLRTKETKKQFLSSFIDSSANKSGQSLGFKDNKAKDVVLGKIANNLADEKEIKNILEVNNASLKNTLTIQNQRNEALKKELDIQLAIASIETNKAKLKESDKQRLLDSPYIDTKGLSLDSSKADFRKKIIPQNLDLDAATKQREALDAKVDASLKVPSVKAYQEWSDAIMEAVKKATKGIKDLDDKIEELTRDSEELKTKGLLESSEGLKDTAEKAKLLKGALEQTDQAIKETGESLEAMERQDKFFKNIQARIGQIFGLASAFTVLRRFALKSVETIRDLDAAFTQIAVVTEKTTKQLWGSFEEYNTMAVKLGATTVDAIQTSALYYQQGLNTADVMRLTTETIKMARIANMDYGTATEAMTSAIRGFKMEMSDAQVVVDVYSALAAKAAVNTQQLATAISKMASIAQSAGMKIQTASAFLTQIIETTQEAPETAGTALKTIIARFTEMNENVSAFKDENGELVDVNKTEAALRTVGILLRDEVTGQIRDVDKVFLELAEKWDSLDRNAQRYVATVASGARQQSRFIAMMDDFDRTEELLAIAENAEGAATTQFNKTLDSVEAKMNQIEANFDKLIGHLIDSETAKGFLEIINVIMESLANIAKLDLVPFLIVLIGMFKIIKGLATSIGKTLENAFKDSIKKGITEATRDATKESEIEVKNFIKRIREALAKAQLEINISLNPNKDEEFIGPKQSFSSLTTKDKAKNLAERLLKIFGGIEGAASKINMASIALTTTMMAFGDSVEATGAMVGQSFGSLLEIINPLAGAIGTFVGGIIGAIWATLDENYNMVYNSKELKASTKLASDLAQKQSEFDAANTTLMDNYNIFIEMNDKLANGIRLTTEEIEKYNIAQDEMGKAYPELVTGRDVETGLLLTSRSSLDKLIESRKAEAEVITAQANAAAYYAQQQERANENLQASHRSTEKSKELSTYGGGRYGLEFVAGTMDSADTDIKQAIREADRIISEALTEGGEGSAQIIDEQVKVLEDFATSKHLSFARDADNAIAKYLNSVSESLSIVQSNYQDKMIQLKKLGNFDANINNRLKDALGGLELSDAISNDLSIIIGSALGEALENEEVDLEASPEAEDSMQSWLTKQLSGPVVESYETLIANGAQDAYDQISTLVPYMDDTQLLGAVGNYAGNLTDNARAALNEAILYAADEIPKSNLDQEYKDLILEVSKKNLKAGAKLANSFKDFDLETATRTQLDSIKKTVMEIEELNAVDDGRAVSGLIAIISHKLKDLGYSSEETAKSLQLLITELSELSNLKSKSAQGTLTETDVIDHLAKYGKDYGITREDFQYDMTSGGYSFTGSPESWNKISMDKAEEGLKQADNTIRTNEALVKRKAGELLDTTFNTVEEAIIAMNIAQEKEITNPGYLSSLGMDKKEQGEFGKTYDNVIALTGAYSQKQQSELILQNNGISQFADGIESAVTKMKAMYDAQANLTVGNKTLIKSTDSIKKQYRLTEKEMADLIAKYPELTKSILKANNSVGDYLTVLGQIEDLKTVESLDTLDKGLDILLERLSNSKKGTQDYEVVLGNISDLFSSGLNADFAAENIDLIRQAANGNYDAFYRLQEILAKEFKLKVGGDIDVSRLMAGLYQVKDLAADTVTELTKTGMFEVETINLKYQNPLAAGLVQLGELTGSQKLMDWSTYQVQILKPTGKNLFSGSTISKPSKSGGGGGSKEDTYDPKVDKYYNEIKAIEALTKKLEDLQHVREQGDLTPQQYKENIDQAVAYYKNLQAKLHDYNNKLRADRQQLFNKIMKANQPKALTVINGVLRVNKEALSNIKDVKLKEELDNYISSIDEINLKLEENSDQWIGIRDTLRELAKQYLESFISVEEKIRDILIEEDQKELDDLAKKYDAMKEADEDYLKALEKNIDARRKARQKEKDYDNLAKKEKRLALLKRDTSGIYANEILNLEQEIADARQELADKETDDMLEKLQSDLEAKAEAHDKELEELNQLQEDKEESMIEYNREVNNIMQKGSDAMLKWLKQKDKEFVTATEAMQKQYLDSWRTTTNEAGAYTSNVVGNTLITSKEAATSKAQEVYSKIRAAGYSQGASDIQSKDASGALAWYKQYIEGREDLTEEVKQMFFDIVRLKYLWGGSSSVPGYSSGGLVDYTGLAMVHGSTSSPEAFLSAEDTRNFKILSQILNNSLSFGRNTQSSESGGIQIGDLNITIEVDGFGSDYDVEKMVNKVKKEVLAITGKTNSNLITRTR